jgi:hypothetical protein
MTTRSREALVCGCGHVGALLLSENDQPYSSLWEHYTLDGFEGEALTVTNYAKMPKDLLVAMKAKCPACGQTGKVKYADRT